MVPDPTATPYLDALLAFRDDRGPTRLMVPGHKGGRAVPEGLRIAFGASAELVLGLDIPLHVKGIDVPEGTSPFEQARQLAAEAWGARTTYFVVGGGSQANHCVCLALPFLARRRPRVAVQRNVHQSIIYGLILADAEVFWVEPELDREFGIEHCVKPAALDAVLDKHWPLDAAFVVSPTYYGAVCDVAALAKVTRRHGTEEAHPLLIVDEAWGAHFPFNHRFPESAVVTGADIVVSSLHKKLGSLTQSAMLHVSHGTSPALAATIEGAIEKARRQVRTTSPSALLYASLDAARAYACSREGEELLGKAAVAADSTRKQAALLSGITVLDANIVDRHESVANFDPLRVTLDVRETGWTGRAIRDALWSSKSRSVEIEFCTDDLILALFGIGDGASNAGSDLIEALADVLDGSPPNIRSAAARAVRALPPVPDGNDGLRRGFLGSSHMVALETSIGKVCSELVAPYPPGVPIVMPGETLTLEVVDYLLSIREGAAFADCRDTELRQIEVLVSAESD